MDARAGSGSRSKRVRRDEEARSKEAPRREGIEKIARRGRCARLGVAGTILILGSGCVELKNYDLNGACGNGIVEASAGEVCDGSAVAPARCAGPEEHFACNYVCDSASLCPLGFACGADRKCRSSDVGLRDPKVVELLHENGTVALGDFDGDGSSDIMRTSELGARV